MNSSGTGGYLIPISAPPIDGDELDALLQAMVVGIVGLPGDLVRPRWQPTVPKQPPISTDWAAIGVMSWEGTDFPVEERTEPSVTAPGGTDLLTVWKTITVLASFYGPHGSANANALHDGVYPAQNREALQAAGIDVVHAGTVTNASYQQNLQWIRRYDIPVTLRAKVARTFKILSIVSAPDVIITN